MKYKTNFKFLIIIILSILSIFLVQSYFSNINQLFLESRNDDTYGGLALKKNSSDFIIDGCGS